MKLFLRATRFDLPFPKRFTHVLVRGLCWRGWAIGIVKFPEFKR